MRPRRGTRRAPLGRAAGRLALLAGAMVLSLSAAEAFLRLHLYGSWRPPPPAPPTALREAHPTRGWSLVPNGRVRLETADYSVRVRINARGLRDVEHRYEPAPGRFRIVVLGDSFMEAYQVALADSLPRRLERDLTGRGVAAEVVNLGVGGYGTAQEYRYLQEEGLRYRPRLVVLAWCPNDVRNNHRELERLMWRKEKLRTYGRPYAVVEPGTGALRFTEPDFERSRQWVRLAREARSRELAARSILDRLVTVRLVRRLLARGAGERRYPFDPNVWLGVQLASFDPAAGDGVVTAAGYRRLWEEAWQVTERLVVETRDLAAGAGAAFVLLLVPTALQVEGAERRRLERRFPHLRFEPGAPNRRLVRLGRAHGFPVLDLVPAFRAAAGRGRGPLFHRLEDRHWNPAGHRLAARALADFLARTHLLSPARRAVD